MCFPETPRVKLLSSEDVFNLLVIEAEWTEIKNQFHIPIRFFQLYIEDGFFQVATQPVELATKEPEDDGLPLDFKIIPYGISNALESYIDLLNHASQFNEINPEFFVDNSSIIVPS